MLKKSNQLLAVLLAAVLSITAFGSDFYSAKVWAADEETVETIAGEGTNQETDTTEGETFSEDEESYEQEVVEETSYEENLYEETQSEENVVTDEGSEAADAEEVAVDAVIEGEEAVDLEKEALGLTEEELIKAAAVELPVAEELETEETKKADEVYPAQSFSDTVAGMNVSVEAEEGAFPEGTTMRLSAISDSQAVSAAENALDGEVKEAKGVDISFADKEGEEIEPKGAVRVSISLADALEGDSFSVVHLDDNGNSEMVSGASSNGASFAADAFSVYILAGLGDSDGDGDDQKAVATYNFYHNGEIFNSQLVKLGDELQDPGSPVHNGDGQVFLAWIAPNEDGSFGLDPFEFGTVGTVKAGATYNVYSSVAYYELNVGNNGAFSLVITVVTGNDTKVLSVSSAEASGNSAVELDIDGQKGYVDPETGEYLRNRAIMISNGMQITCELLEYLIGLSEEKELEPEYTYITYHINYGDEDITYTVQALTVNEAVDAINNTDINWTREGYKFLGWSKKAGVNNDSLFASAGTTMAADNDEFPNDLYAIWEKIEEEDPEDPETPADPEEEEPTTPVTPADPEEDDPATPDTPGSSEETGTPVTQVVSGSTDTEPTKVAYEAETPAEAEADPDTTATPAAAASAELPEVLGTTKSDDLPEVLGARRAATSDTTNVAARIIAILVAVLATSGLILLGKRKEEE
ncbi:MAG: hypothetical protein II842_05530 [Butyrivibrio sp.]|nr:hypothetical protein [Butyrivibrio sp.]